MARKSSTKKYLGCKFSSLSDRKDGKTIRSLELHHHACISLRVFQSVGLCTFNHVKVHLGLYFGQLWVTISSYSLSSDK
eukprot:1668820-Amphidinium_carterae.1